MAQGEFKHITVTPAEDDDIVINAGVTKPSEAASSDFDEEPGSAEASASAPDKTDLTASESQQASARLGDEVGAGHGKRGGDAKKKDDYHEATLEDLRGEPMSLTQKVVIIAAVVCIIGALAYYFLFLR